MHSTKPIPDGYHTVTPYLLVENAAALIDFLKRAFHAKETERFALPDGTVSHAEVQIGDSKVMMGQARGEMKPAPASLYMYVEDVDYVYHNAVEAGGNSVSEPKDQFYGDRSASIKDPAGNTWWIATHVQDLHPEELRKRFLAARVG